MKKLIVLLTVLFVVGLASMAWAQQTERRVGFEKVDANKDGKLTFEEIKAKYPNYTEELHRLNDSGPVDGVLTPNEWYKAILSPNVKTDVDRKREAHLRAEFALMDTNGDGKLSAEEIKARYPMYTPEGMPENLQNYNLHKQNDRNGDGYLDIDEWLTAKRAPTFTRTDGRAPAAVAPAPMAPAIAPATEPAE